MEPTEIQKLLYYILSCDAWPNGNPPQCCLMATNFYRRPPFGNAIDRRFPYIGRCKFHRMNPINEVSEEEVFVAAIQES